MILGRRPRSVADWNISFLVGLSLAATALFPLSWLLHGYALNVTAGALVLMGIIGTIKRGFAAGRGQPKRSASGTFKGFAPKVLLAL